MRQSLRSNPLALLAALVLALLVTHGPDAALIDGPVAAQTALRSWVCSDRWPPAYDPGTLLDPLGLSMAPDGVTYVADRGHDRVALVGSGGQVVSGFGSRGDGPLGLNEPTDVAVDAARNRVYVADRGNKRLAVFAMDGTPLEHWVQAGSGFAFVPWAVAVSSASGDVYVISTQPWIRIERFDEAGRWLGGWGDVGGGSGQFRSAQDVAVHSDGRVLVADTGNGRLQTFSADGRYQGGVAPLSGARSVAVSSATGAIYVLHTSVRGVPDRISVFDADLSPRSVIDSDDLAAPFWPASGLDVDASGLMVLAIGPGSPEGMQGLRQYAPNGVLRSSTMASPLDHAGFLEPTSLEVGPGGDVYLTEKMLRATKRYSSEGNLVAQYPAAAGQEIAVAPNGAMYLYDMPAAGAVALRRFEPTGAFDWAKPFDELSGMGVAASDSLVYATTALSGTISVFDMDRRNEEPIRALAVPEAAYATPVDVALGPAGMLYAAGGETRRIDVFDSQGAHVTGWSTGDAPGPERVSVAPDGTVFALLLDGTVAAYRPDGQLESRLTVEPAEWEAIVEPIDVAAGAAGRVYVLDARSRSVLVYDSHGTSDTPTPPPTPVPPCTVVGTKTASPQTLELGGEVTVALHLEIICPPGQRTMADIVLIIDRSSSMSGRKLADAKTAADAFVQRLPSAEHRVGLVTFSEIVSLDQPLTDDREAVSEAIGAVEAAGATDIAGALARAGQHLAANGRPDALPVILLLTDGNPNRIGQPYVDTVRQGSRARARGALLYSIGLGDNVDDELLTAVAGSPARYFFAPTADQLRPIYVRLSEIVGEVSATDVAVEDVMGPDVEYVAGSVSPPAGLIGDKLVWDLGALPNGGANLSLRVRPTRSGRLPTNTLAQARYVAAGQEYDYRFPVPFVQVVVPPTLTPIPSPTPTPRPGRIALPIVMKRWCRPRDAMLGADIVMVVDTSSSMTGVKLQSAVAASKQFLDYVDKKRDRVGLVSFDSEARLEYVLTADMTALAANLDGLVTSPGTRIDLGLELAITEFLYRGREGSERVIILLSDGRPIPSTKEQTLRLGRMANEMGIMLFAIGLGADADGDLLQRLATSDEHYYYAPGASDLADIYRRIAINLPCR